MSTSRQPAAAADWLFGVVATVGLLAVVFYAVSWLWSVVQPAEVTGPLNKTDGTVAWQTNGKGLLVLSGDALVLPNGDKVLWNNIREVAFLSEYGTRMGAQKGVFWRQAMEIKVVRRAGDEITFPVQEKRIFPVQFGFSGGS